MSEPTTVSLSAKKAELPLGLAGLILCLMRALEFAHNFTRGGGDIFWFISAVGIGASWVGLVLAVMGIFKNSGRAAGIVAIVAWLGLSVLCMFMVR